MATLYDARSTGHGFRTTLTMPVVAAVVATATFLLGMFVGGMNVADPRVIGSGATEIAEEAFAATSVANAQTAERDTSEPRPLGLAARDPDVRSVKHGTGPGELAGTLAPVVRIERLSRGGTEPEATVDIGPGYADGAYAFGFA